jgi:predicted aspartyl protease
MTNYLQRAGAFFVLLALGCHSRPSAAKEQQWQSFLDHKDFFQLRSRLLTDTDGIAPKKLLYFQAYANNAFNKNDLSNKAIATLFDTYAAALSDSVKASLLLLREDNEFKTGRYRQAAETNKQLLSQYIQLDSATADDVSNKGLIDSGLAAVPPQEMSIPGNTTIPWKKDKVGLMEIPVRMRDAAVDAIFDTRANISSITETYAKKLGIHLLNTKYKEGSGITGNTFQVSLGVADSVWLGDILLRHVVFQVMPDSILYIAPIDFRMNIIIGYPVIAQLREVHILQTGSMIIPAQPTPSPLHNLAMDGLNPILRCVIGPDTLIFKFDTGASGSDFFDTYYRRFETDIQRHGHPDSVMTGGAGGVVKQKIYLMKDIRLTVGSKTAILNKVTVHRDPIPNVNEVVYGNLGQDLMQQFNEMILNFDSMYIDFK